MVARQRYFFAAMPPPVVAEQWFTRLAAAGVASRLQRRMSAMELWHQSLSGRYEDPGPGTLARLVQAGERISAHAVTLRFNRVNWSQGELDARSHCTLLAQGRPREFDALLANIREAMRRFGLDDDEGDRPHVTLSYDAGALHPTALLDPIEWTIDEVRLLKGHGKPYRYDILGRWPLAPGIDPIVAQPGLS